MKTWFTAQDSAWLFAVMVAGTTLALGLEQRYRWAARLSGPVIALLLAMLLSNLRLVPAEAPTYDFVSTWLLPLALPLLLLRADLRRMARDTGRLLMAFHIAAVGTVLGACIAGLALRNLLPESSKAAGIMAASYIGGMVNFLAVQESTQAPASVTTALVVADNLVMAGAFLVILWLVASPAVRRHFQNSRPDPAADGPSNGEGMPVPQAHAVTVIGLGMGLTVAAVAVAMALGLQAAIVRAWPSTPGQSWGWDVLRSLITNRFVLITGTSLAAATLFSHRLDHLRGPEELGSFILYLFLFTIGLPADLAAVARGGPTLFALCALICASNIGFTLVVGRWMRLPLEELALGMNATLGGPPTAAAMAVSKKWHALVLPGLLVGLWGYAIGTPLGLLVTAFLRFIPSSAAP